MPPEINRKEQMNSHEKNKNKYISDESSKIILEDNKSQNMNIL